MSGPDDAVPAREADGAFTNFSEWVNKATAWIGGTNALCVDTKGRVCRNGGDMMRAREEAAFPVSFWYGEGGQTEKQQRACRRATRRQMGDFKFRLREAFYER